MHPSTAPLLLANRESRRREAAQEIKVAWTKYNQQPLQSRGIYGMNPRYCKTMNLNIEA